MSTLDTWDGTGPEPEELPQDYQAEDVEREAIQGESQAEAEDMQRRITEAQAGGVRFNVPEWLRLMDRAEAWNEVQALEVPSGKWPESRFAHARDARSLVALLETADKWQAPAVYHILNDIDPAVATRAKPNEWHGAKKGEATSDCEILSRAALYADVDVNRPKGTSSTDAQLRAAWDVASRLHKDLSTLCGPDALAIGLSGNGYALFVALAHLAETPELKATVAGVLAALAGLYETANVKIDQSVKEAKRLCPAFGTVKRKGAPGLKDYPHRRTAIVVPPVVRRLSFEELSAVLDKLRARLTPEQRAVVDKAMGKRPAASTPTNGASASVSTATDNPFKRANAVPIVDVLEWLGLYRDSKPVCPGCGLSDGSSVAIVKNGLKCSHNRCAQKGQAHFYNCVDATIESRAVGKVEAVGLLAEQFGFEGFAPRHQQGANGKVPTAAAVQTNGARPEYAGLVQLLDYGGLVGPDYFTALDATIEGIEVRAKAIAESPEGRTRAARDKLLAVRRAMVDPPNGATIESIRRAVEDARSAAGYGRPDLVLGVPPLAVDDLFAPLPPIEWIVRALQIGPGRPNRLDGYAGSAKSLFALSLLIAVAAGKLALGQFTTGRPRRVRYLSADSSTRAVKGRIQRLARGMGVTAEELRGFLEVVPRPKIPLTHEGALTEYVKACTGVDFVVLDSLRAFTTDVDENDSRIRDPLALLEDVSEQTGCSTLLVHHEGKTGQNGKESRGKPDNEAGRGSSAIQDVSGAVLRIVKEGAEPEAVYGVTMSKAAEEPPARSPWLEPFYFRIVDVEQGAGLVLEYRTPQQIKPPVDASEKYEEGVAQALLFVRSQTALGHGVSGDAVRTGIERRKADVLVWLKDLEGRGKIVNRGPARNDPQWFAVVDGNEGAEP